MRGRQRAERAGAGGQRVEFAEALEQRRAKLVDRIAVAQIERHERGFAAVRFDFVVELFERLLRARHADDAPALARARLKRYGAANAARRAGDASAMSLFSYSPSSWPELIRAALFQAEQRQLETRSSPVRSAAGS